MRAARSATVRSLALPVLGAACAVVPSLVFVYITPRYTADFLPLLVLFAFAGLYGFVRWARLAVGPARAGGRRIDRARRALALELRGQRVDRARLPTRP